MLPPRRGTKASAQMNVYARAHPGPMTRSLPLARSSRTSAFGRIPFAASPAAQVPRGERETLLRFRIFDSSWTQSSAGQRSLPQAAGAGAGLALGSALGGGAWSVLAGGPRISVKMGFNASAQI